MIHCIKNIIGITCLLCYAGFAHAEQAQTPTKLAKGMVMLDYEVIPIPNSGYIDLFGIHYLHQLNDWLHLGIGVHAPLIYGSYGGFMALNTTIHAQHHITEHIFLDAGVAGGGGGGGSSVSQSKDLSGQGGYIKAYAGAGYRFQDFSTGLNFTHFAFTQSQVNHTQFNIFLQKPVSFTTGTYANAGKTAIQTPSNAGESTNRFTLELNNLLQINPQGSKKDPIHTISMQFSHAYHEHYYLFFGADIGYQGLPLYNQIIGGMGYQTQVLSKLKLYGQLGIGSGGYSPVEIETGSGLLIYPKASAEYMWSNNLGISLSAGYLFAPKGTSKNTTLGLGINYHLTPKKKQLIHRGFRFNIAQQTEFNTNIGGKSHPPVRMLSLDFDYLINQRLYLPTQVNVAYNAFLGYPGYGEVLTGLGLQTRYAPDTPWQGFVQFLMGGNVHGMIIKPSLGMYYGMTNDIAIRGSLGMMKSLETLGLYRNKYRIQSAFASLGISYRFSLFENLD